MKKRILSYNKPEIIKEKIHLNYFLQDSRFLDSFNPFNGLVGEVYAQSGGCFLPGTPVLMRNGNTKKIEEIKLTDIVLSYDAATNKHSENKVKQIYFHSKKPYKYYVINANLLVTTNHRLWVNDHSWKRVDELKLGEYLLTSDAEPLIIQSLEMKTENIEVYNLELSSFPHTFFAGNILAHNGDAAMEKDCGGTDGLPGC